MPSKASTIGPACTARKSAPPPFVRRRAIVPYDDADADFVILTSDNVEFHVHRLVLTLASSVFADMLPIPQPTSATLGRDAACPRSSGAGPSSFSSSSSSASASASAFAPGREFTIPPGEKPYVSVVEDSQTIDSFLRTCYPVPDPEIEILSHTRTVLAAGRKYDAPVVVAAARRALVQTRFVRNDPLMVFAVACAFGLEAEARVAAEKAVVDGVVSGLVRDGECTDRPELDAIPARSFYHLLQLNRTRLESGGREGMSSSSLPTVSVNFTGVGPFCAPERDERARAKKEPVLDKVGSPFDAPDADVVLRSSDGLDFRVSRNILAVASTKIFDEAILVDGGMGKTPVYLLRESSAAVDVLLRLFYPVSHPPFVDADVYINVLSAARRYDIPKAVQIARDSWSAFMQKEPLRFYFVAAQRGCKEEAETCARHLVQGGTAPFIDTLYSSEMETAPNAPYRRLLAYIERCRAVASGSLQLSGLPSPGCAPANSCHSQFPTVFDPKRPPASLERKLRPLRNALATHPSGKILGPDTALAQAFVVAIAGEMRTCRNFRGSFFAFGAAAGTNGQTVHALPPMCANEASINWALAVLRAYASAVDEAVSKVTLELSGMT